MKKPLTFLSITAFAWYGLILTVFGYKATEAAKFADIANSVQDHLNCTETYPIVIMLSYGVMYTFTTPLSKCLPHLKDGYELGLQEGDVAHGMVCAHLHGVCSLHSGRSLKTVAASIEKHCRSMTECNATSSLRSTLIYQQAVAHLMGLPGSSTDACLLKGNFFSDESCCKNNAHASEHKHCAQLVLAYMFGQYELALQASEELHKVKMMRSMLFYIVAFYRGMAALALLNFSHNNRHLTKEVKTSLQITKQGSKRSPTNLKIYQCLLKAEFMALKKRYTQAEDRFAQAIELAANARVTHIQALACERYGIYYTLRGDHESARILITEAYNLYLKWGSRPKSELIKKAYPDLIESPRAAIHK
mmetsp:Transcript_20479/g.44204  ORF Transcript_20479/g.44204 Transcript_20479/m.44204 type:complete len:362 (+) Transcript_20479:2236-3321(+)